LLAITVVWTRRSGWASKPGQERVLAITIRRSAFEEILACAVPAKHDLAKGPLFWSGKPPARNRLRLQWDPDHGAEGEKLRRRAIQLGLWGDTLVKYSREWILRLDDITDFVHAQARALREEGVAAVLTPREEVYPVAWPPLREPRLGPGPPEGGSDTAPAAAVVTGSTRPRRK
jgi:hypothetical protein